MATIRKRGNLQWQAQVRRKGWPVQSRTFDSRNQAEVWAREIESEMDRGIFVSRAEAENTTLREALERYLTEITPKKREANRETNRIKSLMRRQLSHIYLAGIRGKDIADFIKEREQEGAGANTIRLDLAILSHVFEICRTGWGMESLSNPVPLAKATRPKLPPGRDRRLMEGEEAKLLSACPDNLAEVVRFALETAMRRSEIAGLRWENVNLKERSLKLSLTKNRTARTVPLSPKALEVLNSLPRRLDGSVFGMSENAITLAFRKSTERAEINGLTFHDLRHEAISRLFENTDLDTMEIRAISGHQSVQMLARYSHLRSTRLADRLAGKKRGA